MPYIYLIAANTSFIKKKVISTIISALNNKELQEIEYQIESFFYEKSSEILNLLNLDKNKNIQKNILIFLEIPNFTLEQLLTLKKKFFIFVTLEDIPEHYHTFYKYIQFLFDGLFIEPGYESFFEVYGLPTFSSKIFNHDLHNLFKYKKSYDSLIPFNKRLYDFSFVGRLDRPGRIELIKDLENNFPKVFFYDSSDGFLSHEELNLIVQNTKYAINSTSIQPKDTFGFKSFPENLQLQEKSRILEYAANGCILFSEIIPNKFFSTLKKEVNLPIIEIPRGVNKSDFCFNYINNHISNIEEYSRRIYESVYRGFNVKDIDKVFVEILENLELKNAKYSNYELSENLLNIIEIKNIRFIFYREIKNIFIFSKISIKLKLIKLLRLIKEEIKRSGFIRTYKILINLIFTLILNKISSLLAKLKK